MWLLFSQFFFIAPVRAHAGSSLTGSVFSSFSALVKAAGVLWFDFIFYFLYRTLPLISPYAGSHCSGIDLRDQRFFSPTCGGRWPILQVTGRSFHLVSRASSACEIFPRLGLGAQLSFVIGLLVSSVCFCLHGT
jgi:hypothetical protein